MQTVIQTVLSTFVDPSFNGRGALCGGIASSLSLLLSLEDEYSLDEMPAMLYGLLALFDSFFVLFNKVLLILSASVEDDVILRLCCISFGFYCCFVFHVVVCPLELLINM